MQLERTNTIKQKLNIWTHLLNGDYEENQDNTPQDRIKLILARYHAECGKWNNGLNQKAVASWLAGLALNVDYYYIDITRRVASWNGGTVDQLTSKQYNTICDNWWNILASRFIELDSISKKNIERLGEVL